MLSDKQKEEKIINYLQEACQKEVSEITKVWGGLTDGSFEMALIHNSVYHELKQIIEGIIR